jgi:hypothetical protein
MPVFYRWEMAAPTAAPWSALISKSPRPSWLKYLRRSERFERMYAHQFSVRRAELRVAAPKVQAAL